MFSRDTYINRRKELVSNIGSGLLLFIGNSESSMNYQDNTYHFRQDSSFLYYFGLNTPDLFAIIDLDENKEIIFGDELTIDHIVWMGTQKRLIEQSESVGVKRVEPISNLKTYLDRAKETKREIHCLPTYRAEHILKLQALLDVTPSQIENYISVSFIKAVANQRNVKSNDEIVEIEKAVNITADMHIAAMRMLKPGMRESEIAAEVQRVAVAAGGHLSFPTIATINGQTLHNHYHGNTVKEGDMLLLDCGAETQLGYAGDMSSTIPVSGTFTSVQKDIYEIALRSHNKAIELLSPGVKFKEIYFEACREIVRGMKDLGFMKSNVDDAVQQGAHALFFPCGLGHMMGMDVHDMENLGEKYVGYDNEEKSTLFGLKSLRLGRELQAGYVLTIEPGIYFIPELIHYWKSKSMHMDFINYDKVEKYIDFGGVRNEEDFLITDSGARLLGKPIPKSIEEVEKEMQYSVNYY
ncbi:MAG: aminopeptidase P family protein [Marinifilaceae bacterium]|jgi:Xaa-Pro aminopeptidase|nr:aminopeptidase P family protein [Marinifilaceae bacterium]